MCGVLSLFALSLSQNLNPCPLGHCAFTAQLEEMLATVAMLNKGKSVIHWGGLPRIK